MKTTILVAAAVFSLGFGSAFAQEHGGDVATTQFTSIPGVLAQAPMQAMPTAMASKGQAMQVYVTRSGNGTWLFAPHSNGGSND